MPAIQNVIRNDLSEFVLSLFVLIINCHYSAYLCSNCHKLFTTVSLYSRHLDTCAGESEDFKFEYTADETESNNISYIKVEESM